jgi:hypothetical protein
MTGCAAGAAAARPPTPGRHGSHSEAAAADTPKAQDRVRHVSLHLGQRRSAELFGDGAAAEGAVLGEHERYPVRDLTGRPAARSAPGRHRLLRLHEVVQVRLVIRGLGAVPSCRICRGRVAIVHHRVDRGPGHPRAGLTVAPVWGIRPGGGTRLGIGGAAEPFRHHIPKVANEHRHSLSAASHPVEWSGSGRSSAWMQRDPGRRNPSTGSGVHWEYEKASRLCHNRCRWLGQG